MRDKHICIRDCYYLHRLWLVGEVLEDTAGFEDAPPNKHFAVVGSAEAEMGVAPNKTAGDDPRSTKEMIRVLRDEFGVSVDESLPRKKLHAQLVALEQADDKDSESSKATIYHEGGAADPALPGKPVCELSPDELESTTAKQMIAMILRDRGHKAPTGNSKVQYFDLDRKLARGG